MGPAQLGGSSAPCDAPRRRWAGCASWLALLAGSRCWPRTWDRVRVTRSPPVASPCDQVPGLKEGESRGLLPSLRPGFRCADTVPLARAAGGSAWIPGEGSVLMGRHVVGDSLWSPAVGIVLVALESGLCAPIQQDSRVPWGPFSPLPGPPH